MAQKPAILRAAKLPDSNRAQLDAAFDVHVLPDEPTEAAALLAARGAAIRGIAVRKTIIDRA